MPVLPFSGLRLHGLRSISVFTLALRSAQAAIVLQCCAASVAQRFFTVSARRQICYSFWLLVIFSARRPAFAVGFTSPVVTS
ncbi:hypothetical protein KCP77_25025 (plasmid) [Salmonella enterica subsp. enterica]|nr:hypothetical protein KCP77_25025 [Salmonella enterica subsp. enterica]